MKAICISASNILHSGTGSVSMEICGRGQAQRVYGKVFCSLRRQMQERVLTNRETRDIVYRRKQNKSLSRAAEGQAL